MDTIVLKCETQKSKQELSKPFHIWDMLLSIATTYSYNDNIYKIWTYTNKDQLVSYLNNKKVVCYNGLMFDLPLVIGSDIEYSKDYDVSSKKYNFKCKVVDIFYKILENIYRIDNNYDVVREKCNKHPLGNLTSYSLYNVYCCTLNKSIPKNIYDVKAIDMFKSKKIVELIEYNLFKLRFVKSLYEYIHDYGYILNGDYDVVKLTLA